MKDIYGTCDTLILETLFPVGREGKNTVCITVENIQIALKLCVLDLVYVDPDLEIALHTALADLLKETSHNTHIVVDHNDVRLLLANDIRKGLKTEALSKRLLHRRCIQDTDTRRLRAMRRRSLRMLLKTEVCDREKGNLGELTNDTVADLALPRKLLDMRTYEEELEFACRGAVV